MKNKNPSKAFAEWAFRYEDTIVEALTLCWERLPPSKISRFEKALDARPKNKDEEAPLSGAQ